MRHWFSRVDGLLRAQRPSELIEGSAFGSRRLVVPIAALAATYGVFMGVYAVRTSGVDGLAQLAASTVKVPLLVFLTAAITLPSLYVFSAILGSRLSPIRVVRLVSASCAITSAVAASLGPILGFFTVSTTSYPFMVLLNVALLGISGVVGTSCLLRMLAGVASAEPMGPIAEDSDEPTTPSPARRTDPAMRIVGVWVILYAVVGVQMGWVLRPFIGAPGTPFTVFREVDGNAARAIFGSLGRLAGLDP